METFSDALTTLVRETLPGAMEQYSRFSQGVSPGFTRADVALAKVWIGDREFDRSGQLGSFAEDRTFMWAWAKPDLRGMPGVELSMRLREIGIRHNVPELCSELVDLGRFEDPWLAADHLALIAQAILGVRGATKFNHGGRAYTYLLIDDESVPVQTPDPALAEMYRQAADELLAGTAPRTVNTGGTLPLEAPSGFLPDSLLRLLAPSIGIALGRYGDMFAAAPELADLPQRRPIWDRAAGRYYYAERPDLAFEAAEIGHYDFRDQTWEWSDSDFPGNTEIRGLVTRHGADHLAAERVSLGASAQPRNVAALLASAAAHRAGAVWLLLPTEFGHLMLAVTDSRIVAGGVDLDHACAVLEDAADILHPLTNSHNRYPTMRALVTGFLEYHRAAMLYVGEPHFTGAMFGLHELRAEFGSEGGLIRTHYGLMGTLG